MIDTIGLQSPYLEENVAMKIERECIRREGIDCKTGELIYRFTTGCLKGSYDSRIRVVVERNEWIKRDKDKVPVKIDTPPYLKIEGSIHKLIVGHNVYGGPDDLYSSACYFIDFIQKEFDVTFPFSYDAWEVYRVDYALVFRLGNDEVQEFMRGMNVAQYPRRKVFKYGTETLFAPGTTTCIRMYHKGPEFYKHDMKRLRRVGVSEDEIHRLYDIAYNLLRVEVEIKAKKLRDDFLGFLPNIGNIDNEYLYNIYKKEVSRIMNEGKEERSRVNKAVDVERRLKEVYNETLANLLLGTWYRLSLFGEEKVKKDMKKSTYYWHKKKIKDAGITWLFSDVAIVKNDINNVLEFRPYKDNEKCMTEVLQKVQDKLRRYKNVA